MSKYKYIIIGGGMAGDSAVSGIRELDKSGSIAIFSEEKDPPYNRPPLSKSLWKGESINSIWRRTLDYNVEFFPSTSVVAIDPLKKVIKTATGDIHYYERLLLATGGKPRKLPHGGDDVIYFRTIEDYRRLSTLSKKGSNFVVIGGGFIGSEIAAALAMNGKKVTMIFPEQGIGAKIYPPDLSLFLNQYYQDKGVTIISGGLVDNIEKKGVNLFVRIANGENILADAVVAGVGIIPNVDLAKDAGLSIDDGIIVDEFLRTSNQDIYAAGDAASFFSPALEKRLRVEHEDNANTMGKIAGMNMAGGEEGYHHLSFFYSDLFELGYEAVGELDSHFEIFEDWDEIFHKGVIYYGKGGVVRGVLLWNTWGKVDFARQLIVSKKKFDPALLKGLIQ
ncbi:MAG: NAD(P)/FAD-dependent oxidoreductase [Candidatus Kryptoniota bacterium]